MTKTLVLAGAAVLLMSISILGQPDRPHNAGRTQLQSTQDEDFKIKVKDDRVIVRDKSKPVRRALEEMYAKIAEAQRNEDIEALRATRTPDFTVDTANGEKWDLETSLNYSRTGFQQVESNISISNTIENLDVHGDVAVAVVHQQWSRMQMKRGKLRRVDTEAIQTETWVNTKDGWKLQHIGDIKPGAWYIDGKRIDPSKPYDPNAPEFRPD
jgi:ketosteroid isomerase-like protein